MIRLKKIPKPKFLDSKKVRRAVERNRTLIAAGDQPQFPPLWNEDPVRKALDKRHYRGKCCYTERRRDIQLERDVEHFRPKGPVTGENHRGYWWLAYDWDNLLIASKVCNSVHKGNHFPLLNGGIRAYREEDDLGNERPVLINPALEDPSEYITFHWEEIGGRYFCKPVPTAEDVDNRGRNTIEIIGLNRRELMGEEERAESGKLLNRLAKEALVAKYMLQNTVNAADRSFWKQKFRGLQQEIKRETAPERTYAGARRAFFAKYDLADCVST